MRPFRRLHDSKPGKMRLGPDACRRKVPSMSPMEKQFPVGRSGFAISRRESGGSGQSLWRSMKHPINRREFITASAALAGGVVLRIGPGTAAAQAPAAPARPLTFKTKPHKAVLDTGVIGPVREVHVRADRAWGLQDAA